MCLIAPSNCCHICMPLSFVKAIEASASLKALASDSLIGFLYQPSCFEYRVAWRTDF